MYNSQYYTCEQIDERLLQGYVDDYNTQTGQSLTKEQFLTKLGNVFAKETIIDNTAVNIGYFVCDTAAGTAAKAITAAGYELFQGGSIKVKFTNRNTAGSATLNINSKGAKALYYGGKAVSASNSWDNGEVVEIYYDGTSYYANNVEGNFKDGIFDISTYNLTEGQPTKYATLAEALGTNGNNVPPIFRKGGMQIKYVSTYDNKYIQARLMAQNFTTDVTQWQGVDDEPIAGSDNLITSDGAAKIKEDINYVSIEGANNTYVKRNLNFVVKGHTYKFVVKHTLSHNNVTATGAALTIGYTREGQSDGNLYYKNTAAYDEIDTEIVKTIPNDCVTLYLGGRCDAGSYIDVYVEDITDLQALSNSMAASIAEINKHVFDISLEGKDSTFSSKTITGLIKGKEYKVSLKHAISHTNIVAGRVSAFNIYYSSNGTNKNILNISTSSYDTIPNDFTFTIPNDCDALIIGGRADTGTAIDISITNVSDILALPFLEEVVDNPNNGLCSITEILPDDTTAGDNSYINEAGKRTVDANYHILRYSGINAGDVLYIKANKESPTVFQFQDSNSLPGGNSLNPYIVGDRCIQAYNGFVVVPNGATRLFVSCLASNTTNFVGKCTSNINHLSKRCDNLELLYKFDKIETDTTIAATITGSLTNNGRRIETDSDYVVKRYNVYSGNLLNIHAVDDVPAGVLFFSKTAALPGGSGNPNADVVGDFVNTSVDGIVEVPVQATYLFVCTLAENSTLSVKNVNASDYATKYHTEEDAFVSKVVADIDDDTIVFACTTDQHYALTRRGGNQLVYAEAFKKMAEKIGVDFMVCLGDMIDEGNTPAINGARIKEMMSIYHDSYLPFIYTAGHHEMYPLISSGGASGVNTYTYPLASLLGQTIRFGRHIKFNYDSNSKANYYFEFDGVRFIVIDSVSNTAVGFNNYAVDFLRTSLNTDLKVVVFAHVPTRGSLYSTTYETQQGSVVEGLIGNFIQGGGAFIAYICGHTHWDNIYDDAGFRQIMQCCQAVEKATIPESIVGNPVNYDRVSGEYSEYCFDVYCIHSDKINIFRFGAGNDRVINLT